jgi:hypothetical protein
MVNQYRFLAFLLCVFSIYILTSCSRQNPVEEYFRNHELSYPADVSGVSKWGIEYVNIEKDELLAPGAQEFVESGLVYIKGYLQNEDISMLIPGVQALVVSKPVLYRNEKEEVGLMVKIDAFGGWVY